MSTRPFQDILQTNLYLAVSYGYFVYHYAVNFGFQKATAICHFFPSQYVESAFHYIYNAHWNGHVLETSITYCVHFLIFSKIIVFPGAEGIQICAKDFWGFEIHKMMNDSSA